MQGLVSPMFITDITIIGLERRPLAIQHSSNVWVTNTNSMYEHAEDQQGMDERLVYEVNISGRQIILL